MEEMERIKREAKKRLAGYCRVCSLCNGVACAGEVPGMGGAFQGLTFQRNVEAWGRLTVNMRNIHGVVEPQLSTLLLGEEVAAPIISAPIIGASLNLGGLLSDWDLALSILKGSRRANLLAMTGDGPDPRLFDTICSALREVEGEGIPVIKPLEDSLILERIEILADLGVPIVGIDIDAAAFTNMVSHDKGVGPKTPSALESILSQSPLPLLIKGIMTPEEAWLAYEVGMKAIVVSNHGGRILDGTPSTAEVLPSIVERLKETSMTILVDGGIRSGLDVLKALALGAHGVLIGRPLVIGAVGGGEEGVFLLLKKFLTELRLAMISTGVSSVTEIDPSQLLYQK